MKKTKYLASPNLIQSLKVAEMLNRPLLLTGEPGTGKTKFAEYIRYDAKEDSHYFAGNLRTKVYGALEKFYTKSTSLSQDIFYDFDSIGYFATKQMKEEKPITAFIYLKSLGKAVCNALGREKVEQLIRATPYFKTVPENDKRDFIDYFLRQLEEESYKFHCADR